MISHGAHRSWQSCDKHVYVRFNHQTLPRKLASPEPGIFSPRPSPRPAMYFQSNLRVCLYCNIKSYNFPAFTISYRLIFAILNVAQLLQLADLCAVQLYRILHLASFLFWFFTSSILVLHLRDETVVLSYSRSYI